MINTGLAISLLELAVAQILSLWCYIFLVGRIRSSGSGPAITACRSGYLRFSSLMPASSSRVDSQQLNEYQFLLDRARQCAAERGQIPNFVTVNIYLNGDVFNVVD